MNKLYLNKLQATSTQLVAKLISAMTTYKIVSITIEQMHKCDILIDRTINWNQTYFKVVELSQEATTSDLLGCQMVNDWIHLLTEELTNWPPGVSKCNSGLHCHQMHTNMPDHCHLVDGAANRHFRQIWSYYSVTQLYGNTLLHVNKWRPRHYQDITN